MSPDITVFLLKALIIAPGMILAITLHEAAHGFVAWRLGDDTAYRMGRVTFNPLRHIDPIGTIILPALLVFTTGYMFGYAKPVPVNFRRLRQPRRDMVLVAAAGPGSNVAARHCLGDCAATCSRNRLDHHRRAGGNSADIPSSST